MKLKILLITLFVVVLATGSLYAQDPGNRDTVCLIVGINGTHVWVEHWIYSDQNLVGSGSGYGWGESSIGLVLDSISDTLLIETGYALITGYFENNSLTLTNTNKRYLLGGAALLGNIPGAAARRLWATFHFTMQGTPTIQDSIVIDTLTFNPISTFLHVAQGQITYQPIFECRQVIENPMDVDIIVGGELPTDFALEQNYPNPFNPSTEIKFDIPKRTHVKLGIYNVLGQQVQVLVDKQLAAGKYIAEWDSTDKTGARVASGVYFYKLEADDFVETKKMMLVK